MTFTHLKGYKVSFVDIPKRLNIWLKKLALGGKDVHLRPSEYEK
jgi:hypothetical protein